MVPMSLVTYCHCYSTWRRRPSSFNHDVTQLTCHMTSLTVRHGSSYWWPRRRLANVDIVQTLQSLINERSCRGQCQVTYQKRSLCQKIFDQRSVVDSTSQTRSKIVTNCMKQSLVVFHNVICRFCPFAGRISKSLKSYSVLLMLRHILALSVIGVQRIHTHKMVPPK